MMHSSLFSRRTRGGLRLAQWLLALVLVGVSVYLMVRTPQDQGEASASVVQRGTSQKPFATPEESVETFTFDPNTADSTTLLRLGLAPWQVRAMYKYRAKHGRYHTPEDFMNVPGMTGELYDRLAPYIVIGEQFRLLRDTDRPQQARAQHEAEHPSRAAAAAAPQTPASTAPQTSTTRPAAAPSHSANTLPDSTLRPKKLAAGSRVDLATADTALLQRIPGIASYRARKIVEYRRALGGFTHVEQVMEACQLPDEVLDWFTLSDRPVQRININTASVDRMRQHPYISFYMARDINEYRQRHGRVPDEQTLLTLPTFNASTVERIRDYIEY